MNTVGAVARASAVSEPTNGAQQLIEIEFPYIANITVEGIADIIFHAWNCEAVEEKATAKKGSAGKKTDNVESYVYRNGDGVISLPSEYLRMSIVNAARFRQDPRSSRKSAMDLFKAGIATLEPLCPLLNNQGKNTKEWDYLDKRRVTVQRAGITRVRPAFTAGWKVEVPILVNLPEYISPMLLNDVTVAAGKLIGLGDFRPTYGRFLVVKFEVAKV